MASFNFTSKLKLSNELKKTLQTEDDTAEVEIHCDYFEKADGPYFLDLGNTEEIVIENVVVIYEEMDIVEAIDEEQLHKVILAQYRKGEWLEDEDSEF